MVKIVYASLQADDYAKGFISLGILDTGIDCISIIGAFTMEALAVWAGCISIGVASAVSLIET